MGSLDQMAAVVPGAGRGIGRAHALPLASEGAAVVVNDLGGAQDDTRPGASPALQVAEEIRAAEGVRTPTARTSRMPPGPRASSTPRSRSSASWTS